MAESDNRQRFLLRFAEQAEDGAAGLHRFRESLPRSSATRVAAVVSELFAISAALRQIHEEERSRHHGPSFWRIQDDLILLFKTFRLTLEGIFNMFARGQEGRAQTIWEDLHHQMDRDEGCKLQTRLELYRDFLDAQHAVLEGRTAPGLQDMRQDLRDLLENQERLHRRRRRSSAVSGAATPRPRISSRPPMHRMDTPSTTTIISDEWDSYTNVEVPPRVPAPEVPLSPLSPQSPTFTSGSSQTMSSSQTSYSSNPYAAATMPSTPLIHWAQGIFDGSHTLTRYSARAQSHDRSACFGAVDLLSLPNLGRDGFQRVLQMPFDEEQLWVRLYWRQSDHRARILVMTQGPTGQQLHYCTPLTNLKVVRNGSCLQLCRARSDGQFILWARLNFLFHERMVLFYSTFEAMKRQDKKETHQRLLDHFELEEDDQGEQELFAGEVRHGDMYHALRLFRDRGSNVVRLEACPLRGPKKDVPIWTAFVTRYAYDPDWAHFEGNGIVSVAAIKPSPSVFITQYAPPQDQSRNYVLPFTTDEDAHMFMESWAGLCRTHGRHL